MPVPDEQSAPFWAAAADTRSRSRALLALRSSSATPRISRAPTVAPPIRPSPSLPSTGTAPIRSWTVVRQSFLPGFDDVPFVLVDVELQCKADLRMIGRLRRRSRRRAAAWVRRCSLVFEDIAPDGGRARVRSCRRTVSGRMEASNQVAIVGYAQSPVERHADQTSRRPDRGDGAAAPSRMPGSTLADVDGFVTASLFPTAGAHAAEDGVSLVSANWLAEHLGINPSYAAGFQGFGQIPGRGVDGGQRRRRAVPPTTCWCTALCTIPAGQLPREPDAGGPRVAAVDGSPGLLRSAGDDRPHLQRVPPTVRRDPRGHGRGRRRGPQERGADPVVLLVRGSP